MSNTYVIIDDVTSEYAEKLAIPIIPFSNQISDEGIHDFVLHIFDEYPECIKLLIPCDLGEKSFNFIGLQIGLLQN